MATKFEKMSTLLMNTDRHAQTDNVDLVKKMNSTAVYRLIDQQGPISRIQLAELSHLAPASITRIIRQLLERGLIKEVEQQASTGGRRAISIVTKNSQLHTLAVRVGRHDATITLFNMNGKSLNEKYYTLGSCTQEALEETLFRIINLFIENHRQKRSELIAIAVSLPGLVDTHRGIVRYMPHISVDNWLLADKLWTRFNVASFIGNNVRSFALAEHYFGASRDCKDSILVRLHCGISAGIVVNSQVFLGNNGNVGEIGHIQIDPIGERCYCGNFGCLETVTSNAAIENRVRHLLTQGYPSKLTVDNCHINAICKAASGNDLLAREIIENVSRYLGKAIAIMTNLFNPQRIVIAGEITKAQKVLLPAIQSCINTQVLQDFRKNLPVVISTLDHHSAICAFALAKRSMLNGVLLQKLLAS